MKYENLQQVKEHFKEEIDTFAEKARAFQNGEMERKAYKSFSGGFGSYAQRGESGNMLRFRLVGGRVTMPQLKLLADCAEQFGVGRFKITTCQTIQLHDLSVDQTVDLMRRAIDYDIITRGGGGDHPRNVMVSPLSGFEQGERMDVRPVAEALSHYLLCRMSELKMPRKLKIGFVGSEANEIHATFRDLGFVARADGTFDVYCAGGLGPNPKLGVQVGTGILPENVAYETEAMIQVFCEHGNYDNRAKARTRYLQDVLGADGLKEAFAKAREKLCQDDKLKLSITSWEPTKKGNGVYAEKNSRVVAQKQEGLYAVIYHPIGGVLSAKQMAHLYHIVKNMQQVELRLSPKGFLYIVNLTADEAKHVLQETQDSAQTIFESSTSCIGAQTCQQGVRDSQGLLHECVQAVREAGIADGALPCVNISGCPSSCGTHQAAALGFVGGVKMIDKVANPAFTLFVGGQEKLGSETLGGQVCTMLQTEIPDFLVELGQTVQATGDTYQEWITQEGVEALRAIAMKYAK